MQIFCHLSKDESCVHYVEKPGRTSAVRCVAVGGQYQAESQPPSRTMESGRDGGVHAVCRVLTSLSILVDNFFEKNHWSYLMVKIVVQLVFPATQDKHESK